MPTSIKNLYRNVYNHIKSRHLRVAAIKGMELFNMPIYRINLDTNNTCNLRCIMCYMSLEETHQGGAHTMPLPLFEKIAAQTFGKTRFLELSCGFEPFMNKGFIDYARIARQRCPGQISICTNALLMKDEHIHTILSENLLNEIIISIDGITDETYNQIRVKGQFTKLLTVLESLKRQKADAKHKPMVRINYTMLARNIDELTGIYDFAQQYDIDIVQLRHTKITEPFMHIHDDSLFFHQEHYDKVLRQVREQFTQDKNKTLIYPPLFSETRNNASVANKASCAYAFFNFIISSNGDVNMCSLGNIGNFERQDFQDMINSEKVKNTRRRLLKGDYQELCKDCYIVSDMGDVQKKDTFIQEELQPDRLREFKIDAASINNTAS